MTARRAALLIAVCLAAPDVSAQQQPGGLRGRVREAGSGAPIAGAEVIVTGRDAAAVRHALADEDGTWVLAGLPQGRYAVLVRALGYRPWRADAMVGLGITTLASVALQRGVLALDAVVVTATRRTQQLADVAVPTAVVTREQIERSVATDVSQLLLEQTGIEVQGGHPVGTGVLLQGLGDQRVLVLLDGQPVVGRISGMIDLSRISVSSVERIEIVKGPQSTLYGSAAMGGVINIITRAPPDGGVDAEASASGGSQGRKDGFLRLGLGGERARVVGEFGRRTTEVVSGLTDSTNASTGRWDIVLKGDVPLGAVTTSAAVNIVDERQQWRTGPLWLTYDNLQWNARTGLRWHGGPHRFEFTAYGAGFDHTSRRSNSPTPPPGGDAETQGLLKLDALYGIGGLGRHALDLGLSWQQERIRSVRVVDHARYIYTVEPFAQHTLDVGPMSLVTGARVTSSTQWGTAVTPQAALRWRAGHAFTVRAAGGLGYRSPDFKELAITFVNIGPGTNYVVGGNPDLVPEHSRTVSLGVELAPGATYARAQTFYTTFRDFIESAARPDSSGLQVFTYQNRAEGRTAGIELEGGAVVGPLRLEAGYAWLATKDGETGGPLLNRAAHTGRATAQWAAALGLRASATGVFTGATPLTRDDATGAITSFRPGWLRIDTRVGYEMWNAVDFSIGVENLFDARPEGWPGFTGRRVFAGASWKLRSAGVRAP